MNLHQYKTGLFRRYLLLIFMVVSYYISYSQTVPIVWESHTNTQKDPSSTRIRRNAPNTTPTFLSGEAILQNRFYPEVDGGYIRFKLNPSILEINDFRIVVEEYNYVTNEVGSIVMIAELNNGNMKFGNTFNASNGRANTINFMPLGSGENQIFRIERTANQLNLIRELTGSPINAIPVSVNPTTTLRVRCNIWNRNVNNYLISFIDIYETNLPSTLPLPHVDLDCPAPTLPTSPEPFNYSTLKIFNEHGIVNSVSRSYFDDMGKHLQSQSSDIENQLVFMNETLYDQMGRPVLNTLSAPKQHYTIGYQSGFIREANGSNNEYTALSFDTPERKYSPRTVQNTVVGTLGHYYSANNTLEPYTPVTSFPYSRVEYYDDGTDRVKRIGKPSNQHRLGNGKEGFYASMIGSKELEHYYSIRHHFVSGGFVSANHQFAKEIVEDPDGKLSVVFTDGGGNTVATAMVNDNTLTNTPAPTKSNGNVITNEYYLTNNTPSNSAVWYHQEFSCGIGNYIDLGTIFGNLMYIPNISFKDVSPEDDILYIESDANLSYFKTIFRGKFKDIDQKEVGSTIEYDFHSFFHDQCSDVEATTRYFALSNKQFITNYNSLINPTTSVVSEYLNNSSSNKLSQYIKNDVALPSNSTLEVHLTAPTSIKFQTIPMITGMYPNDVVSIHIYDIKNNELVTSLEFQNIVENSSITLPIGYYKIVCTNYLISLFKLKVSYQLKYTDWAYYYYDDAGNFVGSVAPEGVNFNSTSNPNFKSTIKSNSLGQILESTETDIEGSNRILYRKDGLIRFSQNPQQQQQGKFSYSNYDDFFRVTEVGEAKITTQPNYFINLYNDIRSTGNYNTVLDNNLTDFDNYTLTDRTIFSYDVVDQTVPAPLTGSTFTYLNPSNPSDPLNNYKQRFLAGKISRVIKIDDDTEEIESATWHSYNYKGNIEWTIQYVEGLGYKTIDYTYEDFTGLLTDVIYQKYFTTDRHQFSYYYDCNYRLTDAYSKIGNGSEQHEASYIYYKHGPLKRIELAKDNNGVAIQGIDYTYTILGALKAINEPTLNTTKDPGKDGLAGSPNAAVKPDAFGMQLQYYNNDYSSSLASTSFANINHSGYSNGNIYAQLWKSITNAGTYAYTYSYDHKNQMTNAYYRTTAITDNKHVLTSTSDYNERNITYDLNGNILGLRRNGFGTNINMDQLTYKYIANTNKLKQVTDSYTTPAYADDIESQPDADNYTYNKIGQLIGNKQEGNQTITYNAYGTTKKISKTQVIGGLTYTPSVTYYYDGQGFRIKKVEKRPNAGTPDSYFTYITYYVNDGAGSPLTIYSTNNQGVLTDSREIPLYASGRIGVATRNTTTTNYSYELSDHLGNVRVTIPRNYNGTNVQNIASYYPFGMQMPGSLHSITGTPYRYGYQGQFAEKDPETGFNAFEARMYDSRLGRWLSLDEVKRFPSRYIGMGNNPISFIDKDGRDIIIFQNSKAVYGKGHTALAITNDKGGWTFIEKIGRVDTDGNEIIGGNSKYISKDFNTTSEMLDYLKSYSKKYDYVIEINTHDKNLDQKSINAAVKEAKSNYHFLFSNCMDVVEKSLQVQNFKTSGAIYPNNAFSDIYRLNFNLLSIGNRQSEIKVSNIPSGTVEIGDLQIIQFGDRKIE